PGRKETWKLVFAVYVFALSLGVFIAILDFGLEKLFKQVIL
ncbi:preprotein translocase subunit SecE, partial [Candidatus Saccharibacteria bacterium]|nr:preprotein translocase subunit SecE [Candidatus Saccharibacteria bacterium]